MSSIGTLNNTAKQQEAVYLTQKELAKRWRMTEGTIKKMRESGLMPYFQLPNSSRVLYPVVGVIQVEEKFTMPVKEVVPKQSPAELKREKPVISTTEKTWRI